MFHFSQHRVPNVIHLNFIYTLKCEFCFFYHLSQQYLYVKSDPFIAQLRIK